jgi:probable rRNA maturation factor
MTLHKIFIKDSVKPQRLSASVIRRAVNAALRAEGVDAPCEVSVVITDDRGIHAINREYRDVDAPTDVLSFPLQDFNPGTFDARGAFDTRGAELDMSTGRIPLGDIVLSAERVASQAVEYGHSAERETAYLSVHSVLHLLGYDHIDEGSDKRAMRARESAVMRELGFDDEAV